MLSQKAIFCLCLPSVLTSSVSKIPLTNSGSVPSTIRRIPFFRKSSSISAAISSKESNPSFLATLDKLIIFWMISGVSIADFFMIRENDFNPLTKSFIVPDANTTEKAPPIVMRIDLKS